VKHPESYYQPIVLEGKAIRKKKKSLPVRDRRCIFAAACLAALAAAVVVPTMAEDCLTVDVSVEGDMAMYVLKPRAMV
jgi:hypothetical protein